MLSWAAATFGPSGGTYSVFRDGLLVAMAVSGSPYLDAPGDAATHAYHVLAVSSDCG